MLKITGSRDRLCNGWDRRRFLQVGSLGLFGVGLADVLRLEAKESLTRRQSKKSILLVWQHGGPSQLDTFDMKPDAPLEVRGPYESIETTLPGLRICEKMPFHAKIMDKCTVIRSFSHGNSDHWAAAHWLLTGYLGATGSDRVPRKPSMGSVASHLLGPRRSGVPCGININDGGFGFHGAAHLGVAHNPFRIGDFSYGNEAGRLPTGSDKSFKLVDGLSEDRLLNRVSLMAQFDRLRRDVDTARVFDNLDEVNQQAQEIILSGRARKAFDLSDEDPKLRERYGPGWGEQALLARRFIEAGVRMVTLNTGYWDDHSGIKRRLDDKLPRHDRAVGVLIQDLADRGMLEDTLVITAGEFGRTPKMNKDAGRDHWPQAQSILIAGGGYRHGQIIGATNSLAERPTERSIGPNDFSALVYHSIGLKPDDTVDDLSGRPVHLLPGGEVPRELL
jgi:hypothetical protein